MKVERIREEGKWRGVGYDQNWGGRRSNGDRERTPAEMFKQRKKSGRREREGKRERGSWRFRSIFHFNAAVALFAGVVKGWAKKDTVAEPVSAALAASQKWFNW